MKSYQSIITLVLLGLLGTSGSLDSYQSISRSALARGGTLLTMTPQVAPNNYPKPPWHLLLIPFLLFSYRPGLAASRYEQEGTTHS
jgi:hypothetical protein